MVKKEKITLQKYTIGEEIFSSISHGVGAALGIAGCAVAIVYACFVSNAWGIVGAAIYGGTLIIAYTMSTLYHSLTNEKAKRVFRVLDHTTIFLLIAGTYTPIVFSKLLFPIGWVVLGLVWGAAVFGIIINSINMERFKKISMVCYIASGWAVVIAVKPVIDAIEPLGLWFLLIGGLFYTLGIIFYKMKKVKWMHSVWHLFVLAGSIFQYFCILFYCLPKK